ncbi:TPA: Bsp6I family type II restriction endonuclease [Vibrio parahaemolyticus]|nr:Bsp6I family type II restriction endonuclease [Vibrio parahaemolyticus]
MIKIKREINGKLAELTMYEDEDMPRLCRIFHEWQKYSEFLVNEGLSQAALPAGFSEPFTSYYLNSYNKKGAGVDSFVIKNNQIIELHEIKSSLTKGGFQAVKLNNHFDYVCWLDLHKHKSKEFYIYKIERKYIEKEVGKDYKLGLRKVVDKYGIKPFVKGVVGENYA